MHNNYESEPTSGSLGSTSLCYKDENNMHFSFLLEAHSNDSALSVFQNKNWTSSSNTPDLHNSSNSSQGTPFNGFNESPVRNLEQHLSTEQLVPLEQKMYTESSENRVCPSGLNEFTNLYGITFEDNSSNAVDIQMSVKSPMKTEDECNYISEVEIISHFSPLKLSFNGKINSLTNSLGRDATPLKRPIDENPFVLQLFRKEKSPDLFDNDENEQELVNFDYQVKDFPSKPILQEKKHYSPNHQNSLKANVKSTKTKEFEKYNVHPLWKENCLREEEVLQRIKKCLEGLPPPPSVTTPQLDLFNSVLSRKDEILNYLGNVKAVMLRSEEENNIAKSLFTSTHSLDEAKVLGWREVLGIRQHGFCFNLCAASESIDYLALSIIERFIGCETTSSYQNSPSSAKKRSARMKLVTQSPGNRLSHLARRRATFSSAHLATTSQKAKSLLGHQILMDKKKHKHRRKCTPKRMSSSKKLHRKTPSSSARKRLFHCDSSKLGSLREASKRALFQSPPKSLQQEQPASKFLSNIKPEIANRVEKSKRALFSGETLKTDETLENETQTCHFAINKPAKSTSNISNFQTNSAFKRKRDYKEENDIKDLPWQSSKLIREGAENLTPRALKIKSQSFCIGADVSSFTNKKETVVLNTSSQHSNLSFDHNYSNMNMTSNKIHRAQSDMVAQTNSLTENQRKKLLWAVSQALQEKKISTKHESFKQYAAVLARIVRRLFQEYFQKNSTSNSETMLRLAKRYVHNVINGSSADDIYLQAKAKIGMDNLYPNLRLSGYIGPQEYERYINCYQQKKPTTSNQHVNNSELLPTENLQSQTTHVEYNSKDVAEVKSNQKKLSIQSNSSLQNSSSKNNICGFALRENLNPGCEQRRSEQKNFTGKDQRNVSPYAASNNNTTSAKRLSTISKQQLQCFPESSLLNVTKKVKRQITFDN